MVNFQDPAVAQADLLAFVKFLHTIDGIYIWEYFTTLSYEMAVLTGRRPYRWTIWIYSVTRLGTLTAVIVNLIGFNVTSRINCQAWITSELVFAYIAFAAASLLIVLRIAAIWNRNRYAMALAAAIWLTNVGFLIHGIAIARSVWVPASGSCAVLHSNNSRNNIAVTLTTDVVLLSTMLAGLLIVRKDGAASFGIWRMLYKQGLIWLLLATIAEVPPVVFTSLNLNDAWNLMFQTPALIVMTIAATRMYRDLTDFNKPNFTTDFSSSGAMPSARLRGTTNAAIPLSRVEVSVHTAYENYDGPMHNPKDKPARLSDDMERGVPS